MFLINSILCFLKASIILNVKVVPNDIFKFGGERVKVLLTAQELNLSSVNHMQVMGESDEHVLNACILVAPWFVIISHSPNINAMCMSVN